MLFLINGWSRLDAHLHNEGQAVGDTALNATAIIGSCCDYIAVHGKSIVHL